MGTTVLEVHGQEVSRGVPLSTVGEIASAYGPNEVASIADYLAKPVPITQGTWSTGSTAGTALFNQDTWAGIYANTMWVNKLTGFYGLRATLRVTLVLNATPFHQGRLRLSYYPAAVLAPEKALTHISHRIPITQLPGVEMSTSEESVQLAIPLITPQRYVELTSKIVSWGQLYLHVLSPLSTGASGSTTVEYTIWYSLHDVELFGQTNKAVSAQSLRPGKALKKTRPGHPSEKEEKPLSMALGAGAQFAGTLSSIPMLAPYTGPVAWALNALKGAAVAFGWSKPLNSGQPHLISKNYHWHTTTADGYDNSIPLSVSHDAKLAVLDEVAQNGQDEMSINFVKEQWGFLDEFTVSTTSTQGTQVYALDLKPAAMIKSVATYELYATPVGYLANLFQMYRGGMEVCFKFVKTGFHAGSLAFTYVPGPADATMSLTQTSYCYRTVLDLQEGEQACFRVPYMLPLDYIDTSIGFGRLYVHIVNPLRAPETCASSINVLVYVRGSPDLEFQVPDDWGSVMPIVPQGGEVEATGEIVCDTVGGSVVRPQQAVTFAEHSMSEAPQSLLQLLKRYSPVSVSWASTTDNVLNVIPWTFTAGRYNNLIYTPPPILQSTLFSLIAAPFAFYRGSMRFRVSSPYGTGTNSTYAMRRSTTGSGSPWAATSTVANPMTNDYTVVGGSGFSQPVAVGTVNDGGLAAQLPYQGPYRMAPVTWFYNAATPASPFEAPRNTLSITTGTNRDVILSRSAGDDFQFLFWVGVPRLRS